MKCHKVENRSCWVDFGGSVGQAGGLVDCSGSRWWVSGLQWVMPADTLTHVKVEQYSDWAGSAKSIIKNA